MRGSIICSWSWWTDPLTPPLPMKLMKNVLQIALVDKVMRIRSPWTLADRKGSGRGQWTTSFSFIKIGLVHFQVFSILFPNNFRYLVSHILRFWGILVSLGQNNRYIGIPLPPLARPVQLVQYINRIRVLFFIVDQNQHGNYHWLQSHFCFILTRCPCGKNTCEEVKCWELIAQDLSRKILYCCLLDLLSSSFNLRSITLVLPSFFLGHHLASA